MFKTMVSTKGHHGEYIQSNQEPAYGLYEKVIEIEKWFHEDRQEISSMQNTNTPLVIVGPEGSGRTTLLFQWMEFHEGKSEFFTNVVNSNVQKLQFDKNTYLMHFVNSSNIKNSHYMMLYRLTNRMRVKFYFYQLKTLFDLSQRIEMQNDKIRTFFQRWLELTDKKKKFTSTEKCKVILVIDGIDRLESEENQNTYQNLLSQSTNLINYKVEEEPPDWFPQSFPMSFRVILTCKQNSKAYHYFKNMKVPFRFLYLPTLEQQSLQSIINSHFNTSTTNDSQEHLEQMKDQLWAQILRNEKSFSNHLYLQTFLNIVYPKNLDLKTHKLTAPTIQELSDKSSVEDLFKYTLKHYETSFLPRSKFRRISCIMALSKTGLKKEELKDCLEVKIDLIELFLKIFGFSLLEYKHQFRINNESYKKTIEKFYLQEEIFKNEIHSSIVTILSKVKHFNQNARLIDEVTYSIYKQGNQWLRLKDLLSNLEIFCQLYKPQDKYILSQYWQKLELHGFDPVYEYNKTMEAFVLNYFPTQSELFVILTQLARFFKEFGDLETKLTPEFKHPPLVISPEIKKIKLSRELKRIGGMLVEMKNNLLPITDDEKYSVENYLFMQVFRDKQVEKLRQENPLFPPLQLYYYKRWIWLQFPWFCMDIFGSFSAYMKFAMGKSIHLHMDTKSEYDLVLGSLRIIREARSRKQISGKQQIYAVPEHFVKDDDRSENSIVRDDDEVDNDTKISTSSDESLTSRVIKSPNGRAMSIQNQSQINSPQFSMHQISTFPKSPLLEAESIRHGRAKFIRVQQSHGRLSSAAPIGNAGFQTSRISMNSAGGLGTPLMERKSQYSLAKTKWIDQDYELANLKSKLKPENAVRIVANQVKNYERKELESTIHTNRELVNEYNRIAFEIQQKEKIYQSLQNCILQLDTNSKENQAYEKKVSQIQDKLDQTRQQYKVSKQEQNRLKHIVNYCFKNKADNHEWIHGLERSVKNMVILIKHEKESIINAKNLVIELRKESKELLGLKNERKLLQTLTQQQMYGMLNEKQNIKQMREEFEKRVESVLKREQISSRIDQDSNPGGQSNLEQSNIITQQYNQVPQLQLLHQSAMSKFKNTKTQKRNQNNNLTQSPIKIADSPLFTKNQAQDLIQKFETIRTSAGAKNIDDLQQIIDFLHNYQRLVEDKDFKEKKVQQLRQQKEQISKELNVFHCKDIEKSNAKYEPHRLQKTIESEIIGQKLNTAHSFDVYRRAFDIFIETRVLIEEMRKKCGLNIQMFQKHRDHINGEELIKAMNEINSVVDQKHSFLSEILNDYDLKTQGFSDIMLAIKQMTPEEMKERWINTITKARSRQASIQNSNLKPNESRTHDGVVKTLEDDEEFVPKIFLNHNLLDLQKEILIDDNQAKSNKSTTRSSKKQPKFSSVKLNIPQSTDSAKTSQIQSKQNPNQRKQLMNQESLKLHFAYQTPSAFLDDSYASQIVNLQQKPIREKEQIFYKRVNEMEREQDPIKVTLQAMTDFKRLAEDSIGGIEDEGAQYLEETRAQLKGKMRAKKESHDEEQNQKVANGALRKSQWSTSSQKNIKIQAKPHFEDDNDYDLPHHQQPKQQNEEIKKSQSTPGFFTSRGNSRRKISLLQQDPDKLPTYAKSILNTNQKELLKRLQDLKTNVTKYSDTNALLKKLADTQRVARKNSTGGRFMHQNL